MRAVGFRVFVLLGFGVRCRWSLGLGDSRAQTFFGPWFDSWVGGLVVYMLIGASGV